MQPTQRAQSEADKSSATHHCCRETPRFAKLTRLVNRCFKGLASSKKARHFSRSHEESVFRGGADRICRRRGIWILRDSRNAMTVLSRDSRNKPGLPGTIKMAANGDACPLTSILISSEPSSRSFPGLRIKDLPAPENGSTSYCEWCVLRVAGFVRIRMPATVSHRILANPATKKHLTLSRAKSIRAI